MFKNIIRNFDKEKIKYTVLIKQKDILKKLCENEQIKFTCVNKNSRKKGVFNLIFAQIFKYYGLIKTLAMHKPKILLGSEPTLTHIGKLVSFLIFSEDDVEIIPLFANVAYPFATNIVSPMTCNAGKWNYKKISYDGFHKLAYLHPSVFSPNINKIGGLKPNSFFIIRITNLIAYHDKGINGISDKLLDKIISQLSNHGKIFISSEKKLKKKYDKYVFSFDPNDIHHFIYFAKMYIGDSQSMAVEAALLGTPGIRFNDFNNKIGVLNELENVYKLTTSINSSKKDLLLSTIKTMLQTKNLSELYRKRREHLLDEKINVFSFFLWLIKLSEQQNC